MRWAIAILLLLLLSVGAYLRSVPARAVALDASYWDAEKSPHLVADVLGDTAWKSRGKHLLFVGYTVQFSSHLPFAINLLEAEPMTQPTGLHIVKVPYPVAQNAHRFEEKQITALFLIESDQPINPEEVTKQLRFAIHSGRRRWVHVPVSLAPDLPVQKRADNSF